MRRSFISALAGLIAVSGASSGESFFENFPHSGYIAFNQHVSFSSEVGDVAFSSLDCSGTVRIVVFDAAETRKEIVFPLDTVRFESVWHAGTNLFQFGVNPPSQSQLLKDRGVLSICLADGSKRIVYVPNEHKAVAAFCDLWQRTIRDSLGALRAQKK